MSSFAAAQDLELDLSRAPTHFSAQVGEEQVLSFDQVYHKTEDPQFQGGLQAQGALPSLTFRG